MGYELCAVIAPTATADTVARGCGPGTGTVPLTQGFALVPYTAKAYDHLHQQHALRVNPFDWLDISAADLLAQASNTAALAYVEADYFGGVGTQHAAVWHAGTLAWGPISLAEQQPIPPQGRRQVVIFPAHLLQSFGQPDNSHVRDSQEYVRIAAYTVLAELGLAETQAVLEDGLPDLADNDDS